ncbi:RIP metalloprotease [Corynebacterium durum]|uniref:M50 family metallopeptidase n=1 Tax=Corynebacterium durum TaxID=61592 RepID=UPI0015CC2A90|nr:M50 family metallopeptidase [Corynebacterium durum]MDO4651830.1 M50 family metallopeptidase [Corynebacterium durum]NYI73655.1 membrane-associated protease RseP (regulator of RpoE activity) [Corynebacterium durum]WJY85379.1 Zinc metalloprotease Rip1 [Corynebacterium durum]
MVGYFGGVALFALGIMVTIALHEWGHMRSALACGMKVRRFYVGFGPTVVKWNRKGIEYGFKAVPLGGFCDIAGMTAMDEIDEDERPYAMVYKPWWQRIFVLSGGVLMNILVGLVVLYAVAVTAGLPDPDADYTPTVAKTACVPASQIDAQTLSDCTGAGPAAEAGIREGDRITAVNGEAVASFVDLRAKLYEMPGQTADLTVERGTEVLHIDVPVTSVTRLNQAGETVTVGAIGVTSEPVDVMRSYGPLDGIGATVRFSGSMLSATLQGLASFPGKIPGVVASIFGAERDQEGPMSVVGASRVGGELVERSQWTMFLMMLASLNFFLALFNLVPLPPLDGGHIAVVIYEKIRDFIRGLRGIAPGQPADYTKLMPITYVMSAVLLGIGAIVIIADVVNPVRLFG